MICRNCEQEVGWLSKTGSDHRGLCWKCFKEAKRFNYFTYYEGSGKIDLCNQLQDKANRGKKNKRQRLVEELEDGLAQIRDDKNYSETVEVDDGEEILD